MKIIVVLTLFLLCYFVSSAQESSMESLLQKASRRWKTDSVRVAGWRDSLLLRVRTEFELDSLTNMDLSDSLNPKFLSATVMLGLTRQRDSLVSVIEARRDSVMGKVRERWQSWQQRLNSINDKAGGNISAPDFPDPTIPNLPEMDLSLDLNDNLDFEQLIQLDVGEKMNSLTRPDLIDLPEIPRFENHDLMQQFKVTEADPAKVLEQHLSNTKQVSKVTNYLQGGKGVTGEWLEKGRALQDPDSLKKLAREEIVKRAMNHFTGKENVVQMAMANISKYKSRYSRVLSLTEIPSLRKNTMHGKPFSERFVPGCVIQYQHNNDARVDLNPYVYYRVTGKLSVGGGWSNRTHVFIGNSHVTMKSPAFGPRIFSEFKTWNGISGRAELEGVRVSDLVPEGRGTEWWMIVRVGLKTEYRLYRNIRGIVQIMMPVAMTGSALVSRELITRFGFEFPLKK
jgi:hypothetical protein